MSILDLFTPIVIETAYQLVYLLWEAFTAVNFLKSLKQLADELHATKIWVDPFYLQLSKKVNCFTQKGLLGLSNVFYLIQELIFFKHWPKMFLL